MKKKGLTLYYFLVGALFLVFEFYHWFYPALAAKALIIPVLMIFYHIKVRDRYYLLHYLVLCGLFFSWLGDVFLHFSGNKAGLPVDKELFFLFGLSAFLLTQLIYIVAFSLPKGPNPVFNRRIYLLVAVLAYGCLLIWFLYRRLGDMRIPVIVYTAVILSMLLAALNRHGKINGVSFMLVSIGALLFVVSDSMLAINKFHQKFDFARILIMSTYITAQYLIALGCIKQDESVLRG